MWTRARTSNLIATVYIKERRHQVYSYITHCVTVCCDKDLYLYTNNHTAVSLPLFPQLYRERAGFASNWTLLLSPVSFALSANSVTMTSSDMSDLAVNIHVLQRGVSGSLMQPMPLWTTPCHLWSTEGESLTFDSLLLKTYNVIWHALIHLL